MAEVLALAVLHKGKVAGALVTENAQEYARDDDQRIGGKTVGALHIAIGKEAPENEGGTVHQKNGFPVEAKAGLERHGDPLG